MPAELNITHYAAVPYGIICVCVPPQPAYIFAMSGFLHHNIMVQLHAYVGHKQCTHKAEAALLKRQNATCIMCQSGGRSASGVAVSQYR